MTHRPGGRGSVVWLEVVTELASLSTATFDLDEMFRAAIPKLRRVIPFRRAAVCVVSADRAHYTLQALYDAAAGDFVRDDRSFPIDAGLPGKAIRTGQPIRVDRATGTSGIQIKGESAVSALVIPLGLDGEVIGTLNFGAAAVGAYAPEDLELAVLLGHLLETSLQHSKLLATIRQQRDSLAAEREELHRSQGRLVALLEASDAAVLMVSHGQVVHANEALAQLAGLAREAVVGAPLERVYRALPPALLDAHSARLLLGPIDSQLLLRERVEVAGPPPRVYQRILAPVRGPDRVVLGHVVLYRDITKEAELDAAKAEFVSVVSHELRTPLTSVKTSLGLLLGGAGGTLSDATREFLEIALRNLERLIRLVEDLLDLSRIERRSIPLTLTAVPAEEATSRAVDAVRAVAEAHPVRLERRTAARELFVLAEADRLEQVIVNLLSNAIKFSPPDGRVTVGWRTENGGAILEVTDEGPGIPAAQLEVIFDKFRQLEQATTRRHSGAGLGLTITRGLVREFGGEVWAESELGTGTRLCVRLQVVPAPGPLAGPPHRAGAPASPVSLLVVNPDADVRRLLQTLAEREGWMTVGVSHGIDALAEAQRLGPDVIIVGLELPDMHGLEFVHRLRLAPALVDVPALVVGHGAAARSVIAHGGDAWAETWDESLLAEVKRLAATPRHRVVLLIEDDPDTRAVLERLLRQSGYACLATADGRTGLAWARERVPDVVITDLYLPEVNGLDVLRALRDDSALEHVPAIVITAHADRRIADAVHQLQASLLRKPFEGEVLLDELARLLAGVRAT